MADKRRHKRATAQGLASYVWVGSKLSSSIIENISAGGLFYRTPRPVAPGTPVKIRLVQPGLKEAIELTGSVVSSIDPSTAIQHGIIPGAGIRFDPVAETQRERFNHLLASLGLPPVDAAIASAAPPELPLDALTPVEPSEQSAPFEPSPSYSYRIFRAEAQVEVPTRRAPAAPAPAAEPASRMQPQPIEFEIAPTRQASSNKASDAEKQRLMEHIQGLLKQLTGLQEDLLQRDLELAALKAENAELKTYLTSYKHRFGPL